MRAEPQAPGADAAGGVFVPEEEIRRQRRFMELLRAGNDEFFLKTGRRKTAFVHSYGCQQNAVDGERIAGILEESGYELTDDPKAADVTVYNTCAVRENAECRAYGNTGALLASKRANPDKIICLCGCMMQQESSVRKIRESFPYVDMVVGTHAVHRFAELLYRRLPGRRLFCCPESSGYIAEGLPQRRSDPVFCSVPVSYGCNNFCTYCVVPNVRGRERSRRPEDVIGEARALAEGGAREITLLGQNVDSYGADRPDFPSFPELLSRVCGLDGDFRVRFMTSHPKDAGEELFEAMARCPKAARHLHLPLQSGSDAVLKRMNRRYTFAEYMRRLGLARRIIPGLAVTSDIIVGFPGETDEDFEMTLEAVRRIRYDALFMFIYSERPGTPAADFPDPVPMQTRTERFGRLLRLQERIGEEIHAAAAGRTVEVLAEDWQERYGCWSGRDQGVLRVLFPGDREEDLRGKFLRVKISEGGRHWVRGERTGG